MFHGRCLTDSAAVAIHAPVTRPGSLWTWAHGGMAVPSAEHAPKWFGLTPPHATAARQRGPVARRTAMAMERHDDPRVLSLFCRQRIDYDIGVR